MGFVKSLGRMGVVVCAAAFLALATLLIIGVVGGAVTSERVETVRKALAGELVEPQPEKPGEKDLTSRYEMEAIREAELAVRDMKKQQELMTVALNERRAQITNLEGLAASIRKDLVDRTAALAAAKTAFDKQQEEAAKTAASADFAVLKETFAGMKKDLAARKLLDYDAAKAVRVLKALDVDTRVNIIAEIDKLDKAGAGEEGRTSTLLKMIWDGDPAVVTMKSP